MKATTKLRELLGGDGIVAAPGAYDCLIARIIEREGFPAVYMTGAGTSLSRIGYPDLGLATASEMLANAGAIAAVQQVRNPITLAHRVMDDTEHIMIIGEGAEQFAREKGLEHKPAEWFVVEREYRGWQKACLLIGRSLPLERLAVLSVTLRAILQ